MPATAEYAPKLTYSVDEAAEAIGISRSLVYDEMNAGRLGYIKIGRRRLITSQQLNEYVAGLVANAA
jgi:excisionase family DNA binding protein